MRPLTEPALAEAAGGRLVPGPAGAETREVGPHVVVDSRLVTAGAVFVALGGERTDGHDHVASAAAAGAAAAIVERVVDAPLAQVVVDDARAALGRLARTIVAAERDHLTTVAVTGSAGKTTTKDLLAQLLAVDGATIAPVGSFNNEIGLPLTATQVDGSTGYLVAEMGARGVGHIAELCAITPPDIGVVLNVGTAHLGEFGSRDVIARAKGEIVEAVGPQGWAVLNADDPLVAAMAPRTPARLAWWGETARPDVGGPLVVWAEDLDPGDTEQYSFTLCVDAEGAPTRRLPVALRGVGRHQVPNALAAATAALAAGLDAATVADALTAAGPRSPLRMDLQRRPWGTGDLVVLNDAYNANPESMAAAASTLARIAARRGGRSWAVLGEMRELGDDAEARHEELGALVARLGIDHLVAVGHNAHAVCRGAERAAHTATTTDSVEDKNDVATRIAPRLGPGDTVLVKASRGVALETVADALLAGTGERA